MIKKILLISLVLFSGCAQKTAEMQKEISSILKKNKVYSSASRSSENFEYAQYRKKAFIVNKRMIDVGFYKKSIHKAMMDVSKLMHINIDESFIPNDSYTITAEFQGSFGDFLELVSRSTGIVYRFRNNVLEIVNKELIREENSKNSCKKGEKHSVVVSLENVPIMSIFKYFSKKYQYNFTFNTNFYSLQKIDKENLSSMSSGGANAIIKQPIGTTSLFYSGCNINEAFHAFIGAIDFHAIKNGRKRYKITDYVMESIELPTYFDYKYTSGQTLGKSTKSTKQSSGVQMKEETIKDFELFINKFKSPEGRIKISGRGYITVMDHPRKVVEIKKIIETEILKQSPIELSVSLLRVSMNDDLQTAANINAKIQGVIEKVSGAPMDLASGNFVGAITKGLSASGSKDGMPQIFKALQTIGETKIVREYNVKTRSGILSTFRAVDKIPYVTTSSIVSTASTSVNTEAKFAETGIIINMIPQLGKDGETLNLSTDILISEYLGDKSFDTANGQIVLPRISENEIQVPAKLKLGESVVLTGFNLKEEKSTKEGVPGAIDTGYGFNRIFGSVGDQNKASQIIVVITPKKIKEF